MERRRTHPRMIAPVLRPPTRLPSARTPPRINARSAALRFGAARRGLDLRDAAVRVQAADRPVVVRVLGGDRELRPVRAPKSRPEAASGAANGRPTSRNVGRPLVMRRLLAVYDRPGDGDGLADVLARLLRGDGPVAAPPRSPVTLGCGVGARPDLAIDGVGGLTNAPRGGQAANLRWVPNLDCLVVGPEVVIGAESKLTDGVGVTARHGA